MGAIWWICMLSVHMLTLTKCVPVDGATLCSPPCLLVSNTSDIVSIDYQTSAVDSVVLGLTRAVAMDIHFSLGYIFWSDVTEQNIKRFQIGISSTTTIISGIGVCDGLAVEWRTSQLYWTDTTYDKISVSDLNGNNQRSLIYSGLDEPRAIALDPDSGFMFWTDWGSNPQIERATLSGDQRLAIVTTNLSWPNGLDLDRGNRRIYWVDAGMDTVESVDYDGNKRKLLFQYTGLHLFAVALSPPFLFFTDWNTLKEVHQLDATTGKVLRSYSINGGRPMGIVLYDSSRQPAASSPCAVENGGCSHFCVTKTSGYECVCPTGLTVKEDNKTCEDRVKKFIIFADADAKSTNIISLDVDYFAIQTLFIHHGNQRPIALDFDPVEDRVYWSDVAQGLIVSAFYNATSLKILFRCNVQNPDGLVVDHVGRNLYWTDTGTNRIEVARLDGTSRKLLIKDGLDEPRAIVLDERNGMMYWTDWGANPKIEQAQMDGSARRVIVSGNLAWPNGLTIDQATNRLYWADAYLDKIEVSDLNGGNRQLIKSSEANIHPYGLVVYKNMLYWTDWNQTSISRFNLMDGNQEVVVTGLQKPMDIHVFDPSLMFSGPHNCSLNNGLCSDLYLLKPGGYQCACPTGIALKPDGKNCDYGLFYKKASENFIIFAEADSGEIYKVPLTVAETPCHPLGINKNISRPVAVDYDPIEGKIYWTDVTLKLLARAFPNGSSVEVLAYDNVETPDGIAVDYVGRNLYWTDAGTSKIEVAWLDGSFRKSLITSNIEKPRAIILGIAESKMYWSDWGSSPKIEQANMDGSARTTLVSSGLTWVNSLALDYQNRLLYWCDASLDKIERVDLQGNNRVLILDLSPDNLHPFGLALSDNVLYWTDWNNQSVHKYNMTSSLSEVLVYGMGRPMEIHIYDHTKIIQGSTSCSQLNGGCSHICLPNPHGHRCFCPEGVQLKYDDALTCEGVNRCPQLSAPLHGSLEPCSNLPGKTCRLACDRGHNLNGSTTRTCNSDSAWTGTQTQCNAVTCPALPTPSNGIRQVCTGTTVEYYNTVCLFSCTFGHYVLAGSPSRKCLENGTWSGHDFVCQVVSCPPLSPPAKATLLTTPCGHTYGSTCVFGCQNGYGSSEGNASRTCLETGQWSGNAINCTDILPPSFGVTCPSSSLLVYAERGLFSTQVNWNEPVATDNSGFPPVVSANYKPLQRLNQGSHVIIYNAVDQSENRATCIFTVTVQVINCTSLTVDPGGPLRISNCGNHYGAQCNLSCAIGYRLNGSSTVTCVATSNTPPGFWDNRLPDCQAIRCPSLPSPTNGLKTGCTDPLSESYDTHCSFSCNVGYKLIGSSVRRCLENETWSGETSYCRVINCGPLSPPPFGTISPQSCLSGSNHSQTCRFTCQTPGYVLEGTSTRVCGNDEQWTGSNDTQCRDTSPPSFNNTCPNNMVFYSSECSFTALLTWNEPVAIDNSGHVSISYPAIRPSVNLSIGLYNVLYSAIDGSGNRANCTFIVQVIRKSCPVLQPPIHGSITSFSCGSLFGSQASLSCDTGYRMTGSTQRTCQTDGTWSGNKTICNVVKCPAIKTPSHGFVFPTLCTLSSGVNYKTHCVFMCNNTVGYRLEGERNVSCLERGSWSTNTNKTICKDVQPPSIQCPSDIETPTEAGRSYASVTWLLPDPSDNSNEPLTLTGPLPPQTLNVGKTYITYKSTDAAGLSRSCTFSINVKDLEAPRIASCPEDIHITSKDQMNKVFLPGVTVTDNVGVSSFTTNRPNGSDFTWGEHNITYTASDKARNTAKCHFRVIIVGYTCPDLPAPLNGAKACETWLTGMTCTVHCNEGFGFVNQPNPVYYCSPGGTWHNAKVPGKKTPALPDCSKTHKPQAALVNGALHYLVGQCGEETMNKVIAGNFIALFKNSPFGMAGGCNGKCTIDNVRVVCGENQTEVRRKRDAANDEQTSKIHLTVHFALQVPLPSNTSLVDLNQTNLQILNNMLKALNETDLNLKVSGVVIEYDATKLPVFSLISFLCNKGQVQRGAKCVNCPVGYFFNTTGCHACPMNQYQDQEAQTSCISCPSGTSTFGKTASRWQEDCQEIPSDGQGQSNAENQSVSRPILYSAIGVGGFVVIVLICATIFCVRKHFVVSKPTLLHDRRTYPADDDKGQSNSTYVGAENIQVKDPCPVEICEFGKSSRGFSNMNYLSHDCANDILDHHYERSSFNQSEV